MKILFLSRRIPHRAVTGGHVIVYQRIRRLLMRGHQVGLCTFGEEAELAQADELRPRLSDLEVLPPPRHLLAAHRVARLLGSGIPTYYYALRSADFMRRVGDLVQQSKYDVVVAEFSAMGQYLYRNPYLPAVRKVISCHYSVAASYRQVADLMKYRPSGMLSAISLWRGLDTFELEMYRSVDRVLVLTAQERMGLLRQGSGLRLSVIPVGVDTEYFAPRPEVTRDPIVLFSGHYEVDANRDAVLWFATRIWPLVRVQHPGVRFHVVGPSVTPLLRDLARRDPSIVVTGEVDDLRPYLNRAQVFVCPVRIGSGLRVKVLEAMAAGVPVVTTSLGAEGIPIQPGDTCLMADQPPMMASYISLLLQDEDLRTRMAQQARQLVSERFAWDRCMDQLEQVLGTVMRR